MDYFAQYRAAETKLDELLAEHELLFKFDTSSYPITLTVFQDQSIEAQASLYSQESDGVSSKDSRLVFQFPVNDIKLRVYGERLIISDALMTKIKGLAKKMHYTFLQCRFAAWTLNGTEQETETATQDDSAGDFTEFFTEDDSEVEE